MRRATGCLFGALAMGLMATSVSVAGGGRSAEPTCRARRTNVVVGDSQAQIYEDEEPIPAANLGCVYGSHRFWWLGWEESCRPEQCDGVRTFELAGTEAAYEEFETAPSRIEWKMIVRNLRTGRVVHDVPTGAWTGPSTGATIIGAGPVVALRVQSNGAVAWVAETRLVPAEYEVHAVYRGAPRLLASGRNIAPVSLGLAGNRVSWYQADRRHGVLLR